MNDQSLKALFDAGDHVMHGRRFNEDATEIIRDARAPRHALIAVVVVDSSLAVKWVITQDSSDEARSLIT